MDINRIYNDDCINGMRQLPDESIDLTVTSPPYDNLRAYNGYTFDFRATAIELYRVTKYGGVVVWIVGDATINGSETLTSFRQALWFSEIGFNLHDTMIYQKESPTWNKTSRRYRSNFEYMLVLSKGKVKTFNPIEDQKVKNMRPRLCKSNRNGTPSYELYTPKKEYTARGNIWSYAVGGKSIGHPAVFPLKLATDHILSWSNPGDLVLDPFIGSGTTAIAAVNNGRNFIGYEISSEYCKLAEERLKEIKTDGA
jgi:site-specific DNA-methyltransferase (adenine-specific)